MLTEKWETTSIINENALPAHSSFHNEAVLSLNGKWSFRSYASPEERDLDFFNNGFNTGGWDVIDVPACWETRGYGQAYYFGMGFPKAINTETELIPKINHDLNVTGQYRRSFNIPGDWDGKRVILCFGSVKSAFYCWVNGSYVGMAKGSMLPVEFDVTELVHAGENTVCAEVYQFSDATYIEDQDMWFLSGIYRDVCVYSIPNAAIRDIHTAAEIAFERKSAVLTVKVSADCCESNGTVSVELLKDEAVCATGNGAVNEGFASIILDCKDIRLWSAETPEIYHIRALLHQNGETIHSRIIEFGFRKIERRNELLLINNMPLKLRGVNYHAFTPDGGYAVPKNVMEHDLKVMKQNNINAVRTSHYPQDDYFYHLCNIYGIYVMDECNVESHGVRDKDVPGSNPAWTAHVVDRMTRMVLRDRNHPCVVIWSLGNESSIGENHFRMRDTALTLDKTRPIHYEGGSNLQVSDFVCIGYSSPQLEQQFADEKDVQKKADVTDNPLEMSLRTIKFNDYKNHPILATEYMYCMGNSGTDMHKHTEVFENSPRWCGGFIWDFKDKALLKKNDEGKFFYAYGRDFTPDSHGGTLCCNGIVNPDGIPHQQLYEIKKAYQCIQASLNTDGTIQITNRNSFLNLNAFNCNWYITRNGELAEQDVLDLDIPPRETRSVNISVPLSNTGDGEYFLGITLELKQPQGWADKGHIIAYEQWKVGGEILKMPVRIAAVKEQDTAFIMEADGKRYVINRQTGNLDAILVGMENLLETPLRPSFCRAVTDADLGFMGVSMSRDQDRNYWMRVSLGDIPLDAKVYTDGNTVTAENVFSDGTYKMGMLTRRYGITPEGRLVVDCAFTPYKFTGEDAPKLLQFGSHTITLSNNEHEMPRRFGLQAEIKPVFNKMAWFGKGPHDTYWGRDFSANVGIYERDIAIQDEHMRPQEHGNKRDVRWGTITDANGHGLRVDAIDKPVAVSAWPYTLEVLHTAKHIIDLPAFTAATVNIDCLQSGLGDCFVPLSVEYKLQPEVQYSYAFILSVLQ